MLPNLLPPVRDFLDPLLQRAGRSPHALLQLLIAVQHHYHCIPEEAMEILARELGVAPLRVKGVVSFYSFLSGTYQGEVVIHISDNITDRMQGSRELATHLCDLLDVPLGGVREDGRVSVHYTSDIGLGDQGPAALVNYRPVTRLTRERVEAIARLVNERTPLDGWPREFFQVESIIRRSDVVFRHPVPAGAGLRASLERGGEILPVWEEDLAPSDARRHHLDRGGAETLKELYKSELRGRGGAGFKTAIKWESVRGGKTGGRYVLCNADEGEPGTFKDRILLSEFPDMVFEGMTICGHVVGSKKGIVYLRQEYFYLVDHLEAVLARRRAAGLLGRDILGSGLEFDIEIHLGAGAYICGMESAMIKSIEGRRGIPRRRWPLPVHEGLFKRPTVVNNVETFAKAAVVSHRGGAWFASIGTPQSTGTKLFAVSGDVERPGVYEYPWGVTVRELLRDCGGLDAIGVQLGGPSGTLLNPEAYDRTVCFEDLPSVGTVMVFGPGRDLFESARNFAAFFRHESCGLCTPCRIGTTLLENYVSKFARGYGSAVDLEEMKGIARTMRTMSHCGLGQTASLHLTDSFERFPAVWEARMGTRDFAPAFDLDGALAEARTLTGRTDHEAHLNPAEVRA